MTKKAYKMNVNQFQMLVLGTATYMQIFTPKEIGKAVAICSENVDIKEYKHNGIIEVDIGDNSQLESGQIIIITDLN